MTHLRVLSVIKPILKKYIKTTYGLSKVCLTILPENKVAYLEPSKLQIVQKWHIDQWPHFQKIYYWKVMVMDVYIYWCTLSKNYKL